MKKVYKAIENIYMKCVELLFRILKKDLTDKTRQTFKEFLQFGLVGVSNTIVSYALYAITLGILINAGLFPSIDYFIANVDFKDIGNDKIVASVKANETDIRMWARQYAGQIKITEPKELADLCKRDLLDAVKMYEE